MQSGSGVLVTGPTEKKNNVLPKPIQIRGTWLENSKRREREATKQRWSVEAIWKADGSNSV